MPAPILCPFCGVTAPTARDETACGACGRALVLLGRWRVDSLLEQRGGALCYAARDTQNSSAAAVDVWVAHDASRVDALAAGREDGGTFVVVNPARSGSELAPLATASRTPVWFKLFGALAFVGLGIGIGLLIRRAPSRPHAVTTSSAAPGDPLATTVWMSPPPVPPSPPPVPAPAPTHTADVSLLPAIASASAATDWSSGACNPIEDCYQEAKAWGQIRGTMTVSFDGKGKPTFVSFTGVPYAAQTCLRKAGMSESLDGYSGPPGKATCTFSGSMVRGTSEMMYDSDFEPSKR